VHYNVLAIHYCIVPVYDLGVHFFEILERPVAIPDYVLMKVMFVGSKKIHYSSPLCQKYSHLSSPSGNVKTV
jgi:hypothetical protein